MSLNDISLNPRAGVDAYPGLANPTKSSVQGNPLASNFVTDPTDSETGAGAGSNFMGARDAKRALNVSAGVIESRPGIMESTNIEPLVSDSGSKSSSKKK